MLLGRVYLRLGRLDEAERVLTSALETWPEEPHCQFAIGVLRLRQERLEAAEMSLTRAARAAPRIPGLQEKLGRVLLRLGRVDQARGRFEKAIEQRDCDDLAHGGLATALSIMVETSRARSEFQRAIECATAEHRPPWRAGLATAHAADGRFDEALQELDATEALFPAPAFAALRHRLEQAQRGWSAVGCNAHETICSQASQRLWSAVLLLYVLGAPDAAERQLRESLSLFDGDALSHWLMAVALAELDRREDAELELEQAAAWQPNAEVTAAITALRAELEGEHDDG